MVPGVETVEALRGHNESRQYIGYLEYKSAVIYKKERIKLEIGMRKPLLSLSVSEAASTIASNPFSGQPLLPNFNVRAMSMREAYAEKVRAALSRKEPAIRDFFDLFYAVRKMHLNFHDSDFINMLRAKLAVPGNSPVDVSLGRKRALDRQLESQLRPALRPRDYIWFSLDEAFEFVNSISEAVLSDSNKGPDQNEVGQNSVFREKCQENPVLKFIEEPNAPDRSDQSAPRDRFTP